MDRAPPPREETVPDDQLASRALARVTRLSAAAYLLDCTEDERTFQIRSQADERLLVSVAINEPGELTDVAVVGRAESVELEEALGLVALVAHAEILDVSPVPVLWDDLSRRCVLIEPSAARLYAVGSGCADVLRRHLTRLAVKPENVDVVPVDTSAGVPAYDLRVVGPVQADLQVAIEAVARDLFDSHPTFTNVELRTIHFI